MVCARVCMCECECVILCGENFGLREKLLLWLWLVMAKGCMIGVLQCGTELTDNLRECCKVLYFCEC